MKKKIDNDTLLEIAKNYCGDLAELVPGGSNTQAVMLVAVCKESEEKFRATAMLQGSALLISNSIASLMKENETFCSAMMTACENVLDDILRHGDGRN